MSKRLENKIAIVVGAGQMPGQSVGTGRATALRFMQEGATVLAVDRDRQSAEDTLDIAGDDRGGSATFEADVTNSTSLEAAVADAMIRWGRIDILFYNVGIAFAGGDRPLEEITDEAFDRLNAINLRGAIMAAKYTIPIMRAQKSGAVVNNASVSAIETTRSNIAYRTSKAGLIAFTQQLAVQNAPYGVRANTILPGTIDTPMAVDQRVRLLHRPREELVVERNAGVPLRGKMGSAWDVANAALFLASDEAEFITGVALPVDGGMLARIGY
jgi:NAD(P)-dependent dehydrogenase (short-subunit alcohol dehydrogenase family)